MPGSTTPRQQALERLFSSTRCTLRVTIETTSLQLYRNIIGSTDRLALMSLFEARLNDPTDLTILPFRSSHLKRSDGIATRADWRPTKIHLRFMEMLRQHAQRISSHSQPELFASKGTS